MTRCDYDTIFQRVFCVTLVAIAFTFTVILTNVFVDIDGLLSRKDKGFAVKAYTNVEPVLDNEKHVKLLPNAIGPQKYYKTDGEFEEESNDNYRNKRSLDSQNFLFHMRNPKMKSVLTSRLATLLEELDNEESTATDNKNERPARAKEVEELTKDREEFAEVASNVGKDVKRRRSSGNTEEDLLHMAMHNILLQGIIGHMDLNDVYRKIHLLVNNFKETNEDAKEKLRRQYPFTKQPTPIKLKQVSNDIDQDDEVKNIKNYDYKSLTNHNKQKAMDKSSNEENKFFQEIAECDKLQNDIMKSAQMKYPRETTTVTPKPFKLPNVLIKTIIDISSLNNNKSKKPNNSSLKENVKGIIQLIYNGQSIKFSRMDDEAKLPKKSDDNIYTTTTELPIYQEKAKTEKRNSDSELLDSIRILQEKVKTPRNPNSYLNNLISEYLKKSPEKLADMIEDPESNHKYQSKRYKRQIKIRYQDANVHTHKTKPKRNSAKRDDDELYVEIETHFDSKGMKGEKKRKLIRSLIEKIQKAIHSDIDFLKDDKKRKHRRYHVKKRTQHPLDKNKTLLNKIMIPFEAIIQRQSEPISKSVPHEQPLPAMADKSGESWKKPVPGPGFLQVSKSLNSAELGDVNVDYSKVLAANGIPQRLQKPLNTDDSEENPDTVADLGNMKFFIKDLDGTGLSIGFNQYMDEPPDAETMKLFTGIENIIANYHQNDDHTDKTEHEDKIKQPNSLEKEYHGVYKRDVSNNNEHVVIRRSIKELNEKDYHSNEYKIVFDSKYLPYDSYQEIIEDKNKRVAFTLKKENDNNTLSKGNSKDIELVRRNIKISELPALLGDSIFNKKLKPSEILNLASMLNRRKRTINVKKISNIKNKIKLNKYINSRRMGTKKLILNKKRSKRQIDKIRIIATDSLSKSRNSDEHYYITSDENVLADRAVIREVETPDGTFREFDMGDEKTGNSYHSIIPFIYEETPIHTHTGDGKYRHNSLMSKYPHIFMEEVSRRNEDFEPVVIDNFEIQPIKHMNSNHIQTEPTTEASTPMDSSLPNVEEIVSAITPQHQPKDNYKLTVRIMPKNGTGPNSGFTEIHTSINKSFIRDGLSYTSLVNVSEISKIEKIPTPIEQLPRNEPIQVPSWMTPKKPCFTRRMEEQQIKMDTILNAHKRRLDDQLEHLKKEKMTLDALTLKNAHPKPIERFISNNNPRFDISKLLASTLLKLQAHNDFTTTTTTTTTRRPVESTTTPATPTTQRQTQTFETTTRTTTQNADKYKLIHTIQRNENLTNEILHQINKNTEVLQMFLSNLADKLMAKEPHHNLKEELHHTLREEPKHYQADDNKFWKPMPLAIPANMVPIPIKNVTQVPLPFVYAFEHPFSIGHKPIPEILPPPAHGHIHAAFHKKDSIMDGQNKPKDNVDAANTSRYFIDNMDNEFVKKKTTSNSTNHAAMPPKVQNKRSFAQLVGVGVGVKL